MPGGNGQTLSKQKHHGVCVPRFGLFPGLLVALCCCLEAWGSGADGPGGRSCEPCPVNCSCAPAAGPQQLCLVNCSNTGLERAPAAGDLPLSVSVLDLSKNHISSLDTSLLDRLTSLRELYLQENRINVLPRGVFCCGPLSVLDLSNNQITTIEERICDNLCNLTKIDLSGNPFECDCKLFRLVRWLQEKGVQVRRPHAMLCNHPLELRHQPLLNVSLLTCGLSYAGCLEDSSTGGGRSELVIFTFSSPGNFTRQQCNSLCFGLSHLYGGLGNSHECLCSTNNEPNFISGSQYSAACTDPNVMTDCGWTLAQDVFAVEFSISVKPLPLQSVHDQILFSAAASVTPVTLSWDFGDLSSRVNATATGTATAAHKYGLPGHYAVSLMAWAGHKEVANRTQVSVTLPSKLELHCPHLVVANKSLEVTLVNWGGVGIVVEWTITKDGVQVAKASPNCPEDGTRHESSICFEILPEELSGPDARLQCLKRGGNLTLVKSDTLRNLMANKVSQERRVWLGFSDVNSPGKLRWVNGEDILRPRSATSPGNPCHQDGQTTSFLCDAKRVYLCQYISQVRVPDAGVYMIGVPVFPSHNTLHQVLSTSLTAPQPPSRGIEMLMFPAMSFVQEGRLSSLEFITQDLSSQVHIRFQTYRPRCRYPGHHLLLPSCGGPVCSPVALCVTNDTKSSNPSSCPPLEQWCPFQRRCLPLSGPCQPSSCPNCTH
ncbi:polycystin-1, partial [Austrofundulus limnaeus]